jgi:hypothetical protein
MKNSIFALILFLTAMSCKTTYYDTSELKATPDGLNASIAKDVVHMISETFPPAQTRIFFPRGKSELSALIDKELRSRGYAVTDESVPRSKPDVQLAYKMSLVDEKFYILRLVAGENYQINRIYQKAKDGKIVASGPVLMRRGE